ncbi:hypothetical protein [Chryseobacterium lathyri]|uniref:Positive regulator of sigma E activity n=1 Tax=Chryseobacterium lathyri TaxID=395933 RepID=A0ABT9SIV0_9FLAO|nr:hypothetical protein [Chryseobacterium lathyri]MDP9958751.1 positive regulator of sigma E activity [Chryseobacterium lathyri]MDQ0066789.1 positive regulator of sigma E activity [Chryseobacterium lathyri]
MKTTSKNQYAFVNLLLIPVVSAVFGYNLYQMIVHTEASNIAATLILAVITYVMVRKYGYKPTKEEQDN